MSLLFVKRTPPRPAYLLHEIIPEPTFACANGGQRTARPTWSDDSSFVGRARHSVRAGLGLALPHSRRAEDGAPCLDVHEAGEWRLYLWASAALAATRPRAAIHRWASIRPRDA